MSFAIDTTFTRTLEKAAQALETIEACRHHKLEPSAKKYAMLADTMKAASARFQALVTQQGVYPADTFFKLAFERLSMIRAERKALMVFKRERREAMERERALLTGEMQAAA